MTGSPWRWIPTLYFGQGLPYVAVMTLAVVMYKKLGLSNTDIALYTSWLYLPWVIKPLWSPLVDLFGTKRRWVVAMQWLVAVSMASIALTIPATAFFQLTLACFWLMAFASATHDIAADGFYMHALPQSTQAAFVGIRSTFYRLAMIAGQGALVWLAGFFATRFGDEKSAWQIVFFGLAATFVLLAIFHAFFMPTPASDQKTIRRGSWFDEFWQTFQSFFSRKDIVLVLAFLLTYRLAESQMVKLLPLFLLDPLDKGGLALTTQQLGVVYGTYGVIALTAGGILGGLAVSQKGLRWWLWPMLLAIHLPNVLYVMLALSQTQNVIFITAAIAVEQFGYGFGFAGYLLYMIMIADGPNKTAHYSICTGFMALGMMLPGMVSGKIQSLIGYPQFFMWACLCTIPSMLIALKIHIDPAFGKREA
jgi:MFS transporter, PAT family, beta-lactamase induction signal transducer AmpG